MAPMMLAGPAPHLNDPDVKGPVAIDVWEAADIHPRPDWGEEGNQSQSSQTLASEQRLTLPTALRGTLLTALACRP